MTVGGSTIGSATVVCTIGFQRDDDCASHHATGVATRMSTIVVIEASCTESQSG